MMAGPMITVSSPERKPRKGGIKSVVGEFQSLPRLAVATALQWVADGCELPKLAPGLCYAEVPVEGNKELEGIGQGTGPIFALYAGVHCFLGPDDGDYAQRAKALLEHGEDRGVEEALWEYAGTLSVPGPAVSIVDAIATAEEYADEAYVGGPVLLMSRRAAVHARAAKAILGDEETGRLWTANGTPVIATGAGNEDALYILGWPTVYASTFTEIQAYDPTVNQELAIAERVYGIAVDCEFVFAQAFTIPAGTAGPGPDVLTLSIGTEPASPIPDETDVTVTVHANVAVNGEVNLWYRQNGGAWIDNGEMVEVDPITFVQNYDGAFANPGDVFDLYAKSGTTVSPTITINVT